MSNTLLVINCGSSSIKFALYHTDDLTTPVITALAERLGDNEPTLKVKGGITAAITLNAGDSHQQAFETFINSTREVLGNVVGVGHRVVHGGESFHASCCIDDNNIEALRALNPLAPLHNPINLLGIELCQALFPQIPQVAVFDTAFHQTIAEATYLYGVPYDWYEDNGVRRYGFHGTSYRYITEATAERLQRPADELNLLVAHLGNGCSASAIRAGKSVDTTMGLTPLEGLIMGSRCGDIDPGLIEHIEQARNMDTHEVLRQLNRNSGLLGLSGLSNDMRTLLQAESEGHEGARRAIDVFTFRVARHFSALSVSLPDVDAVVFTGGIGEHAAPIRSRILAHWRNMNYRLDDELNASNGNEQGRISQSGSPLVMVVPTDEERMIAQDTLAIINSTH